MKTWKLSGRSLDIAHAIRTHTETVQARAAEIRKRAQAELDELISSAQKEGQARWAELMTLEGVPMAEWGDLYLDMNYLRDHNLGFLQKQDPSAQEDPSDPLRAFFTPSDPSTRH